MKNKRTKKFNNKLDKINAPEFKKYYNKVWVDGAFKHWHIYNTSPGFSTTNNPVESYNAVIKKFFTNRFKCHMLPCLENFDEVIGSIDHKEFLTYKKIPAKTIKYAKKLIEKRKKFLVTKNENEYTYENEKKKKYKIDFVRKTCTCPFFQDRKVCKHLTMVCYVKNISIPGLKMSQKYSIRAQQRMGRPKPVSSCLNISE